MRTLRSILVATVATTALFSVTSAEAREPYPDEVDLAPLQAQVDHSLHIERTDLRAPGSALTWTTQRPTLRPPRSARAWLVGGGLGLVGGAVLTSVALATAGLRRPLTTMLSNPGQSPLLMTGTGTLVAAYVVAKAGVIEAKRAGAGDRDIFFLRPQLNFASTGFQIGVAGRF